MIAAALMRIPWLARAVRYLAGVGERPPLTFAQQIAIKADELRTHGYGPLAALAAAEAVLLGEKYWLRFDRIEYREEVYMWVAYYEGGVVVLPLEHATEATQVGVASLN